MLVSDILTEKRAVWLTEWESNSLTVNWPTGWIFSFSVFLISPSLFLSLIGSLFIRWLSVDTSCRLVCHIDAAHSTDRPHARRSRAEEWQMTVVRLKMILYYEVLQICILIIGVVLKYDGVFFRISAMSKLICCFGPMVPAIYCIITDTLVWI